MLAAIPVFLFYVTLMACIAVENIKYKHMIFAPFPKKNIHKFCAYPLQRGVENIFYLMTSNISRLSGFPFLFKCLDSKTDKVLRCYENVRE